MWRLGNRYRIPREKKILRELMASTLKEQNIDDRDDHHDFQECKDKGTNIKVDVYSNDTFVDNCGTIELSNELTQTSQEYRVICEFEGNTVLLSKTATGQGKHSPTK
jgi:hypothetical protein